MICNACGSSNTASRGVHQPYEDYQTEVFDCLSCGARFVGPEQGAHEELHAASGSSYGRLRSLTAASSAAFAEGDRDRLAALLAADPKFTFVMSVVDSLPPGASILEVGCASGYLTAYLVLAGYECLGVDVSPTAIETAVASFGDHYALTGSERMLRGAPYDAIVHVGTIGCVPNPVEFTRDLLGLLGPGGVLAFNSPNVEACRRRPGPWGSTTQPPDLVTLFEPGFWTAAFGDEFDVTEVATPMSPYQQLAERRRLRRPEDFTEPHGALRSARGSGRSFPSSLRPLVEAVASGIAKVGLLRPGPAEFGLYVEVRRPPGP